MQPIGLCAVFPLPVELFSFSAACLGNQAEIKWSTASETNNDYFTIERAINLQGFQNLAGLNWEAIGTVKGAGNSSTTKYYSFIDTDIPSQYSILNTQIYYRLKQTDFDGKYEYFNPVSVTCKEGIEIISIYPNPFNGSFSYSISSSVDAEVSVTVSDIIGKKVIAQKTTINKGLSTRTINAWWLSSGMYYIQIRTSNGLYRAQKQVCVK